MTGPVKPDAYVEGESAYYTGAKLIDCPYPPTTPEADAWIDGYATAKRENEGCCP
jgi:hypothetical protein